MKNTKRHFLQTACLAGGAFLTSNATAAATTARLIDVTHLGADTSGKTDSTSAIQAAIDRLASSGGTVYFPIGTYRVSKTLEWRNPTKNDRLSGILFLGDGMHTTRLCSTVKSGPLLRVRGIPQQGPINTTFFWGGGIQGLTLDGRQGAKENHDAIEILGWWYGELNQLRICNFSRHGIRAVTDLAIAHNPDFSASTLFIKAVCIERCAGWGYKDDGGIQGSPSWTWSHTIFLFCGEGGAYVQSSSHTFTKCSFALCGWSSETAIAKKPGYGLCFDGAATAASRQWVEGCEFDTNSGAHIALRFASTSSFLNNRFIFNDRQQVGHLCPPIGVQIGVGDIHAAVHTVEFRQNFFRFDTSGKAIGFSWINTANVRDIAVVRSLFSETDGLLLTRYHGHEANAARTTNNYLIED